jgi:hypothetical protein
VEDDRAIGRRGGGALDVEERQRGEVRFTI